MSAPPGRQPATTARRGASNRVIRRIVSDRAYALARRAGVVLPERRLRDLAQSFIEAADLPDDERELDRLIIERLMQQAPGGRKPIVRRHGLGGPGWRVAS